MPRTKPFQAALDEGLRVADLIHRNPDRFTGDAIIIPVQALARGRRGGLTPGRWKVLATIRSQGPFDSLEDLADAMGRPLARISQDVQALRNLDLVVADRRGRRKQLRADPRPILVQ